MTSEQRYIGVARPPQGIDPHPPRLVVNLAGPPAVAPAPIPTIVDAPAPETRPWVRASVAAADIHPVRYGRFAGHRKRIRRAILRRFELVVWGCAVMVVVGLALVVVRGAQVITDRPPVRAAATAADAAPSTNCAFDPCPAIHYTGPPTRVRIPAIHVDSALEYLVLDAQDQLEPPKDYQRAGWFRDGVAPGDAGAAVIAGHVDSLNGPAVFFELNTLRAGDVIEVDRGGRTVTFHVTGAEQYPKNAFPKGSVYDPTPGPELRLITCGGSFDPSRGSYRDNIVVYAIAT